ncbi:hypothetical protein D3C85_1868690 [compost metagenome]
MQRSTNTRMQAISVLISASVCATVWNSLSARLKALRSRVYRRVQSRPASAEVTAMMAICRRSHGSSCIR